MWTSVLEGFAADAGSGGRVRSTSKQLKWWKCMLRDWARIRAHHTVRGYTSTRFNVYWNAVEVQCQRLFVRDEPAVREQGHGAAALSASAADQVLSRSPAASLLHIVLSSFSSPGVE